MFLTCAFCTIFTRLYIPFTPLPSYKCVTLSSFPQRPPTDDSCTLAPHRATADIPLHQRGAGLEGLRVTILELRGGRRRRRGVAEALGGDGGGDKVGAAVGRVGGVGDGAAHDLAGARAGERGVRRWFRRRVDEGGEFGGQGEAGGGFGVVLCCDGGGVGGGGWEGGGVFRGWVFVVRGVFLWWV